MIKTQFQTESMMGERSNRLAPSHSGTNRLELSETQQFEQRSDRSITATVEPMFLGLLLRGWITEREQQFLDDLVPARSLSFLISNGKYIHPAGVELFPHDLIETSIEQRNPAIFSHLCPPSDQRKGRSYRISTATINPDESEPIVFGVFGPDYELATIDFEGKFLGLIECLRSGFKTARMAESLLQEKELLDKPTIIINRASGRIMAVSQRAVDHFGVAERTLVDQEFGVTQTLLPSLMIGTKRRMENISCNGLSLASVSTTVVPESESSRAELTAFLTGEIENRLSLLVGSSSNSNSIGMNDSQFGLPGQDSITQTVVTHIKHDLEKINHLASSDSHETQHTNILWELDRAVETVSNLPDRSREILINNRSTNLEHRAPKTLLANLFESILMAHQTCLPNPVRTEVHILRPNDSSTVCVKVKTKIYRSQEEVHLPQQWIACAERLAQKGGITVEHSSNKESTTIITRINIEQNKEQ